VLRFGTGFAPVSAFDFEVRRICRLWAFTMQWVTELEFKKIKVAVELARKGVALSPDHPGNWLILGRALVALGKFQDAAAHLREAVAILPASAELRLLLVQTLMAQDLLEEALPHAETALVIAPDDALARYLTLELIASSKNGDGARLDMDAVAALSSISPRLMEIQANSLGPVGTLELCDAQLAENPAHTNSKYLKAIALAVLGRTAEARKLMLLDKLIELYELPVPPNYADGQSFRDALAKEIRANPTLTSDPRNKATRDGFQTRRLRQPDALAVEALLDQVKQAVETYVARLEALGDSFVMLHPEKARLDTWAVIYGSEGRQRAHCHPSSWLSGVYYVAAPRLSGEKAYRGPLIMGALDSIEPPWGTREIEPVPGRLVLFPSYVPHATEPSGIDGARISVAFDVVPVQ
jgi:uncharacterized protein (TIGR02466 family)